MLKLTVRTALVENVVNASSTRATSPSSPATTTALLCAEPSTATRPLLLTTRRPVAQSSDVVALEGYQLYVVEQWYTERTRPLKSVVVYTGDTAHRVLAVSLTSSPPFTGYSRSGRQWFQSMHDFVNIDKLKLRKIPSGNLYVGSLTNLDPSLNIIHIPDGNFDHNHRMIAMSINMRRLGCGGRTAISLRQSTDAQREKFYQLFNVITTVPLSTAITELVKLVQISLYLLGSYQCTDFNYSTGLENDESIEMTTGSDDGGETPSKLITRPLSPIRKGVHFLKTGERNHISLKKTFIPDGLLCDQTMTALDHHLSTVETLVKEQREHLFCEPSMVARLISKIALLRTRLSTLTKEVVKDPFSNYLQFQQNVETFQRTRQLQVTGYLCTNTVSIIKEETNARLSTPNNYPASTVKVNRLLKHKLEDIRETLNIDELTNVLPTSFERDRIGILWANPHKLHSNSISKGEMTRFISDSIRGGGSSNSLSKKSNSQQSRTRSPTTGRDILYRTTITSDDIYESEHEESITSIGEKSSNKVEELIQGGKELATNLLRGVGASHVVNAPKHKSRHRDRNSSLPSESASSDERSPIILLPLKSRVKGKSEFTSTLLRNVGVVRDFRLRHKNEPRIVDFKHSSSSLKMRGRAQKFFSERNQTVVIQTIDDIKKSTEAFEDIPESKSTSTRPLTVSRHLLDALPLGKNRRNTTGSGRSHKMIPRSADKWDKSPTGFRFLAIQQRRESILTSSDGGATESDTGKSRFDKLLRLRSHRSSTPPRKSPVRSHHFVNSNSLPRSPRYYHSANESLQRYSLIKTQTVSHRTTRIQKEINKQRSIHKRAYSMPNMYIPEAQLTIQVNLYTGISFDHHHNNNSIESGSQQLPSPERTPTNFTESLTIAQKNKRSDSIVSMSKVESGRDHHSKSPLIENHEQSTILSHDQDNTTTTLNGGGSGDGQQVVYEEVLAEIDIFPQLRRTHSTSNVEVIRWRRSRWVARLEESLSEEIEALGLTELMERESRLVGLIDRLEPYTEQLAVVVSTLHGKYEMRQEEIQTLRNRMEEQQDRQNGLLEHMASVEHALHHDIIDTSSHHEDQFASTVVELVEQCGELVRQLSKQQQRLDGHERMNVVFEVLYAIGQSAVVFAMQTTTRAWRLIGRWGRI